MGHYVPDLSAVPSVGDSRSRGAEDWYVLITPCGSQSDALWNIPKHDRQTGNRERRKIVLTDDFLELIPMTTYVVQHLP